MKMKNLTYFGLAAAMVLTTPVFAASSLKDSIGSVNGSDNGTSVGVDASQGQKTTYSNAITADTNDTCNVYATQASTFSVVIPKTIVLTGTKDTANSGSYVVTVKGNIAGTEVVNVTPDATFKMSQAGKEDITATVTQTKTKFQVAEAEAKEQDATKKGATVYGLDNASGATQSGTIEVENLTAGSWTGSFKFNIGLN